MDDSSSRKSSVETSKEEQEERARSIVEDIFKESKDKVIAERMTSGGYHHVYKLKIPAAVDLVSNPFGECHDQLPDYAILRFRIMSATDTLTPLQVRQEIGIRKYVRQKCGDAVPQPKIYVWNDGSDGSIPYILEEFINAFTLDFMWFRYSLEQRNSIIKHLAVILSELADLEFPRIGALDPHDFSMTQHVELCRRDYGRDRFHDSTFYDIGPYETQRDYVLAHFQKEISFYNDGTAPELDFWDADFDERRGTKSEYAKWISAIHDKIASEPWRFYLNDAGTLRERFAIAHGDLVGRNIMVDHETAKIVAILDWEYAAVYPISQFWTNGCETNTYMQLGDRNIDWDAISDDDPRCEELGKQSGEDEEDVYQRCRQLERLMRTHLAGKGWDPGHISLITRKGKFDATLKSGRSTIAPFLSPWFIPGAGCGIQLDDGSSAAGPAPPKQIANAENGVETQEKAGAEQPGAGSQSIKDKTPEGQAAPESNSGEQKDAGDPQSRACSSSQAPEPERTDEQTGNAEKAGGPGTQAPAADSGAADNTVQRDSGLAASSKALYAFGRRLKRWLLCDDKDE